MQFAWWGPFRPDTVPLAVDGINVATGPNGAGKTAFLDGIKLLLGTDQLKAKPIDYIHVSGTSGEMQSGADEAAPAHRAQRALLRAVFANPERDHGQGRMFADAGRGCEHAPFVTAICEVTRDRRRYILMPGRVAWGERARPVEADLTELQEIPNSRWMNPKQWQGLMTRAGISRSLVHLMSMGQGETDKAIHGTPEQLLRRTLELTGRQQIIDDFRETKKVLSARRADHRDVSERFRLEQQRLEILEAQVRRHDEYREACARIEQIERLELPVARHRAAAADLEGIQRERAGTARNVEALQKAVAELDERIPQIERELRERDERAAELGKQADLARSRVEDVMGRHGGLERDRLQASAAAEAAADAHAGVLDDAIVAATEEEADAAAVAVARLRDGIAAYERMVASFSSGRPVAPAELDAFRIVLDERRIAATLIAERLDSARPIAAEAALHDGVWAIVVETDDFEDVIALAAEHGYGLPIVCAGAGTPTGALAGTYGLPEANKYLEELSAPIDEVPGVSSTGLVRGRSWAAWRRSERPVLGAEARRRALEEAEAQLSRERARLPQLELARDEARARAHTLRTGLEAIKRLPSLERELAIVTDERAEATQAVQALAEERDANSQATGRISSELRQLRDRRSQDANQLTQSTNRLAAYGRQLVTLSEAIVALTPEQKKLEDVESEDALSNELGRLRLQVEDDQRFPPKVRSEMVVVEHSDHERRVAEIGALLEGRAQDLEQITKEVERGRERYQQHIRQVVGLVGKRFGELCDRAGMEGQLRSVPSEIEGELGLDLRVAHVRGERLLSSRHPHHSGGQRVKMAILLLLASMGVEGATDLLIMDEHSAHLDSRNIDHVADLMNQLKGQVQFILAMPSHAEALRLAWCDHQLAFYLRDGEESYAPPIRLLTRLPNDGGARYVEHMGGQLPIAD